MFVFQPVCVVPTLPYWLSLKLILLLCSQSVKVGKGGGKTEQEGKKKKSSAWSFDRLLVEFSLGYQGNDRSCCCRACLRSSKDTHSPCYTCAHTRTQPQGPGTNSPVCCLLRQCAGTRWRKSTQVGRTVKADWLFLSEKFVFASAGYFWQHGQFVITFRKWFNPTRLWKWKRLSCF